jgi:4-amino-4-deoxy-L-arabinose transferase-like glycosyltransferase
VSGADRTALAERPVRPARRRFAAHPVPIFGTVLPLAAVVCFVNLRAGLDFDLDEVMYAIAGQNIATGGSVSWGAQPIFVHPPLYFLILAGWTLVAGTAHGDVLPAILSARQLGAAFSVLTVLLTGLLAQHYAAGRTRAARGLIVAAAMVLATFDGFLVRFGRTGLIEPTAIFAGLLVVYLALRLRNARSPVYVGVLGVASGLALLVKEPLLFTVVVPVLAALLERDWAYLRRATAAVLAGLAVWGVFPLWALLNGAGAWWWAEHDTSLHRLAGFLQVSGLNRAGVSATGALGSTVTTYLSGYLIFGIGACGLLSAAYRGGLFHRRPLSRPAASLVAFGALSYGFLAYCVLFGQANEQLTVYSAAPAVLLSVLPWRRPTPRPVVAACLLAVVVGVAGWVATVVVVRDDATVRTGQFLAAQAYCAPVNATGNALRWAPALPANRVYDFRDGKAAVNAGLHLFLLSPKDSRMLYGTSSPELDAWVRAHGRLLHHLDSRRYEQIEVWEVPGPAQVTGEQCGNGRPPVAANASSASFLVLLAGLIVVLAAALYAWSIAQREQPWDDA